MFENFSGQDLSGQDFSGKELHCAYFTNANLSNTNFSGASLRKAQFGNANLTGANLTGADLIGAYFVGADLTGAKLSDTWNPYPMFLLQALDDHTKSRNYSQRDWCGTACCLAGCAGALVGNKSVGVAVIAQVLPEFDLRVLYQGYPFMAINELVRVSAIYQARHIAELCKPTVPVAVPVRVSEKIS